MFFHVQHVSEAIFLRTACLIVFPRTASLRRCISTYSMSQKVYFTYSISQKLHFHVQHVSEVVFSRAACLRRNISTYSMSQKLFFHVQHVSLYFHIHHVSENVFPRTACLRSCIPTYNMFPESCLRNYISTAQRGSRFMATSSPWANPPTIDLTPDHLTTKPSIHRRHLHKALAGAMPSRLAGAMPSTRNWISTNVIVVSDLSWHRFKS